MKRKTEYPMILAIQESVLLEIDVQNDFCPSYITASGEKRPPGALAVAGGDAVIRPLNALAVRFAGEGGRVIATADWHPAGHCSFAASYAGKKPGDAVSLPGAGEQVLWPAHCVQGTEGAAFHDRLDLRPVNFIIRKGFRRNLDSYSAFFENDRKTPTGLDGFLKGLGVKTVVLGGLATDYCVLYSALDAAALGYRTVVLKDAIRGVGLPEGSVEKALADMEAAGIVLLDSGELA
ncbi:MAG: bifunctional nicotinamidase/pyrazinamidase [Treponema sp.]|jgi:nicotinamidase/pyrazinamidase|nr:bifunctional nicotinamidase/pyrazinamidase [Treponema sp.]